MCHAHLHLTVCTYPKFQIIPLKDSREVPATRHYEPALEMFKLSLSSRADNSAKHDMTVRKNVSRSSALHNDYIYQVLNHSNENWRRSSLHKIMCANRDRRTDRPPDRPTDRPTAVVTPIYPL